ncbi:MAG TPA: 16S rRNA (guanine(966)-N(2))-methyltransferase RsmD [Alphaproteobacteria bacterium]
MRIVAGRHKGRGLAAPKGRATRPTTARAREGLFDMLAHGGYGEGGGSVIAGARVLEAFCGTGAFAFEALSRGAAAATLLDLDEAALDAARDNAKRLGERTNAHILRMDALRPRNARGTHSLVFMDPPYGSRLAAKSLAALARKGWMAPGAVVVVEIGESERLAPPSGFEPLTERAFGAARFVLMRYTGADTPSAVRTAVRSPRGRA